MEKRSGAGLGSYGETKGIFSDRGSGRRKTLPGKPPSKILRSRNINEDGGIEGDTIKYLHAMEIDLSTEDGLEGLANKNYESE